MAIRLSGLNSGLDTDTIVQALVSSYSYKKDTYTKAQTKLSWTQDAWKSLNTKVYSLYSNISSLRYSSAYTMKKTSVSDNTKATVTASNSAVNGSQKLNILQVAQAGYLTGGKLDKETTTSTTLAELGYTKGEGSINVDKGDGTSTTITVSSSSTVGDVVDQLKKAGLNASLDTTNSRMFISAKDSGKENDFNLIGADENGLAVLSALGLNTSLYTTDADGNKVTTAAGAAYTKYGTYAMAADGSILTDEQIRQNITDSLNAYKAASGDYKDANTQISNLTSALTYAKAYANVQDFYTTYKIGEGDQKRFSALMALSSDARGNALVDDDGNIYTKTTGTDTDGNTVYGYVDADGNKTYVSKEVTYYDKDNDVTYKKTGDNTYVGKDANGNEITHKGDISAFEERVAYHSVTETISYDATDADGNKVPYDVKSRDVDETDENDKEITKKEYFFTTDDGKEYVSNSESGEFKYTGTDDDGKEVTDTIKITKNYSYESADASLTGLQTGAEAYDVYKSQIATSAGISEDEAAAALTTFASNLSTVNAFESKVTDTESVDYSRFRIKDEVQKAYAAGGTTEINTLVDSYAEKISNLKTSANEAQATMDANEAVSSLATIDTSADSTKLDEAIKAMVTKAKNAAQVLAANSDYTSSATKMDGQDAIIKLNNVEYTSASNAIEINGITVNAMAVTGDGDENAITITTSTDTQGIYDKIKEFLTEYNSIINEMCKLYNAASSKGYDPLTDDEKDAMSDSEIEKWETKIKDSLLRHDSTLNGVMTAMTSAMSKPININGKNYSLSSFGINTLGYLNAAENENYAYHIDGDEDDSNTSGKTDKLMAAITSDPDTVTSFFQQLTGNLYNAIGDKMKSTSLSSIYTVYNDKQMDKQYKEYTKLIAEWEERISTKEEYYYSKFSSMETALAKLNSTQSSLSGYFS